MATVYLAPNAALVLTCCTELQLVRMKDRETE